ncbi:hypothetical protein CP968_20185 [Streptomyces subrutilus]|uniref:Uncharacterized protein n=1 Tax=Streptomyces subrutilus TaxID=36818 RepID=A0A5P2UMD5_9ACTN|nr:hypothetical protein CP968_20185 [Streptomyces subrutilus]
MPGKSVWPPLPPVVAPPVVAPPVVVPPVVVPPVVVPPVVVPPVVVPPVEPAATSMVAPAPTSPTGAHFVVKVPIGNVTATSYAPGVRVILPALVSLSLPFMADMTMGAFFGISGFFFSPATFSSPPPPPTVITPVGRTESWGITIRSVLFEAGLTVSQTTSTSSPTLAVAGAVIFAVVSPSTGPPPPAGGTHLTLNVVSAAWAGEAARAMPAPPSSSATTAALTLRWVFTNVPSSSNGSQTVRTSAVLSPARCPG